MVVPAHGVLAGYGCRSGVEADGSNQHGELLVVALLGGEDGGGLLA